MPEKEMITIVVKRDTTWRKLWVLKGEMMARDGKPRSSGDVLDEVFEFYEKNAGIKRNDL